MTDQTIVALYDDQTAASRVLQELHSAGFDRGDFWISGGGSSGSVGGRLSSLASDFSSGSGRVSSLTRLGVPQSDAEIYAEGVRRGGALLVGVVDDDESTRALDIIERHGPTDIDERGRFFRESGWAGYDHGAIDYTSEQTTAERSRYAGYGTGLGAAASGLRDTNRSTGTEEHIPIVEENLEVGKRAVQRGGVRVHTRLVETPVEQSVTLRDETVSVERRAVDRPVGDIPADALRERSIEVTETDEVPVVAKSAHIREEVVIRKDVQERAETVRDTVRHTEVDIDKTDGGISRDDINRRDRT